MDNIPALTDQREIINCKAQTKMESVRWQKALKRETVGRIRELQVTHVSGRASLMRGHLSRDLNGMSE